MPIWLKVSLGFIAFALASVGVVYLAGFFYLVSIKSDPFATNLLTYYQHWYYYHDNVLLTKRLNGSALIAAMVGYGAPLFAIAAALKETRSLHGEARFARTDEIEKAGLFATDGIIIGKWKKRFLVFSGMQFVLLAAPTRSGKGVGIVIPNCLNYAHSLVVLDVKLENFELTSLYRAMNGQKVFLFNPFADNRRTHRYNPLGYISDDPNDRIGDILSIGKALYPGHGREAFFDDAANNLFLGLALYLCETPELPRTVGELLRQSSGKGKPVKEYLAGIIDERNFRDEVIEGEPNEDGTPGEPATVRVPITQWDGQGLPPLSMECVDALNRFTSTSDNTLSSIMATFNVPLTIWANPIVDAATSANDFDLRTIRKQRLTIYVGIPANRLAEADLLINLFFSQLIHLNTSELLHARPELKVPVLLLMDEFTAPGRIGAIDAANAHMAGYGLRLMSIIQSPSQLEAEPKRGYGRESARTLMTNHACQIFYTPREQKDANEYSEMLGYQTVKSMGTSKQKGGKNTGGYSESLSDQKRALMLPQELKEMPQNQQVINLENTKPILCTKIMFYKDHVFLDRLKSVSPSLRALGKKIPSQAQLQHAQRSGELATVIPLLDLDLHAAVVQQRTRAMTAADVEQGVDLSRLAIMASKLPVLSGDAEASPADVKAYVSAFFGQLEGSAEPGVDGGWEGADEALEDAVIEDPADSFVAPTEAPSAAYVPPVGYDPPAVFQDERKPALVAEAGSDDAVENFIELVDVSKIDTSGYGIDDDDVPPGDYGIESMVDLTVLDRGEARENDLGR